MNARTFTRIISNHGPNEYRRYHTGSFPLCGIDKFKVRPAVVICETKDKYRDVVVSAVSSVVPPELTENEILIEADSANNLRTTSIIKVDRIVTVKKTDIIARIGKLSERHASEFKIKFKELVDRR